MHIQFIQKFIFSVFVGLLITQPFTRLVLAEKGDYLANKEDIKAQSTVIASAALAREAVCGDNFCNLRVEDHWACPQDCKGTYYIADLNNPNCSYNKNATGVGSIDKPLCELLLLKGVSAADSKLLPGDTVYLRGGRQSLSRTGGKFFESGSPGAYITFRNYPDETPLIELGSLFDTEWVEEPTLAADGYKVFSSRKSIKDAGFDIGTVSSFSGFALAGANPPSRLLSLADLKALTSAPGVPHLRFDAYYLDCVSKKVYLRLKSSVNAGSLKADSVKLYFNPLEERINIWGGSHLRFIGLNFKHGNEAFKFNNGENNDVPQFIEIYDSSFDGIEMPISDHSGNYANDLPTNFHVIDHNTFRNNSPLVDVEIAGEGNGRGIKCVSELAGKEWQYVRNRWDHIMYGSSKGVQFSNNFIDGGGSATTLALVEGNYFNNHIRDGEVYYVRAKGHAKFFNNILESVYGGVFHTNGTTSFPGAELYNNLFLGGGTYYDAYSAVINFSGDISRPKNKLKFKNNIVIGPGDSAKDYCLKFDASYAQPELSNNLYLGCRQWYWDKGSGSAGRIITDSLSKWSTAVSGEQGSSHDPQAFAYLAGQQAYDLLQARYSKLILDQGVCLSEVTTDMNSAARPQVRCDIGPYERHVAAQAPLNLKIRPDGLK